MEPFNRLIQRCPELEPVLSEIRQAGELLENCFRAGGKLLVCGNGGSAADSEHIVGELMKGYNLKRPIPLAFRAHLSRLFPERAEYLADHLQGALPAISLVSHTSLITAFINDVAADMIFAQQVYGYGRPGDVLLGISCSGKAPDVLNALQVARAMGLKTLGFSGRSGGSLPGLCDVLVRVPEEHVPDIQEEHEAIYHALCAWLEERFFKL